MPDQRAPETAQQTWERIVGDYHRRYPETARILALFAEQQRVYEQAVRAMHPTRYWTSDHANMTDQTAS